MSADGRDGMDPEDWVEQFNKLSEENVALIESLRTQLEEQKALVAGVVEGLELVYILNPLNWRELLFKKIIRLKTGNPSAQQDAAILKAAREHHRRNNGYFLGPETRSCSCAICKAVRVKEEG